MGVVPVLVWLGVTLGVALGSALLPLVSIELFLIGLVSQQPGLSAWMLGAVVAVGQVGGKLLYFLAARGSLRLPEFLHSRPRTAREPRPETRWTRMLARWRRLLEAVRRRCHRHPHWMTSTHAVSSVVGLPPFMATTVLAGLAGMSIALFIGVGLTGRFLRFTALAASPALFAQWLH
ncbi:hypothetical protein [Goodfellowiella coeruleoviolacea]|uniref:Membrane protein YqaA with SNARE-associated domain n=1 Tax=Goodfellowiella coeruleoviolacea TaxID=334858 RepID=A0AAE3KKQ1_9PSEU|nr:hypothetical protein [Goodfellowiella coeruleoviolacea]MCP2169594.1 hypothetical protein [Goodfellowiella coeruleoviolacea]